MSLSVILPAYKEADNLKILLPKLYAKLLEINTEFEILVIDSELPLDNTQEVCESNNCTYINRAGGNQYGDAIKTGILKASKEFIVIMDADGSHNPDDIAVFYDEVVKNKYDIIIGSRYIDGGNTHNGFILRLMSHTVNITYRIIFGLKVKDVSNSFRLYDASKLKQIKLDCNNFDIVEEILIRLKLKYSDIKIKEVPIFFNKRVFGESKRDLLKFMFSYVFTIVKLIKIQHSKK